MSNSKKKKNIFFINEYFPPDYASTGQLINDLAMRMAKQNYKIKVFTSYPYYANQESNAEGLEERINLIVWRTKITKIFKFFKILNLFKSLLFSLRVGIKLIFEAKEKDVIFFTTAPPFMPVIGYFSTLITKSPYIVILFDLIPEILIDLKFLSKKNFIVRISKFLRNLSLKNARNVVVLSNNMLERIKKELPKVSNKLIVIPTWEDTDKLYKLESKYNNFINNYNLKNKLVILYSGNQGRCHDFLTILKSAKFLAKKKQIFFIVVGNGYKNRTIKNYQEKWNLRNFLILPYLPKKDLIKLFSAADVGLVSVIQEATEIVAPSKLYGYLACENAIAAICDEKSYLKEIVESNNCGKWFKNDDYIKLSNWLLELVDNKKGLNIMKKNSRKYIMKNANLDIIVEKYIKLVENQI